ncbi:hypothetical protein ACI7RC_26635 [Brevibacillus sp. B_LB10_24]|uniref:hypothetical protein n=1 Tax=Brevibacillus sp. B_LB10_24 TaxID=3380645 RepID=UPI0038BB85E1
MRYEVKKGTVKHKGVFYPKGSFFDAEKHEVKGLIATGALAPVQFEPLDSSGGAGERDAISTPQTDMTIEELKKFLEDAGFEEVERVLEAELAKPEPRKTAVKLLNDWLENADAQPPTLDADDVIVE